jgi:hypothetical protein
VVPHRRSGRPLYYEFRYDLENQLRALNGVQVHLQVFHGTSLAVSKASSTMLLPTGITGGKFSYAPEPLSTGFGKYRARLLLVHQGELLTHSQAETFVVQPQTLNEWTHYAARRAVLWAARVRVSELVVFGVVAAAGLGVLLCWLRRRTYDRSGGRTSCL